MPFLCHIYDMRKSINRSEIKYLNETNLINVIKIHIARRRKLRSATTSTSWRVNHIFRQLSMDNKYKNVIDFPPVSCLCYETGTECKTNVNRFRWSHHWSDSFRKRENESKYKYIRLTPCSSPIIWLSSGLL